MATFESQLGDVFVNEEHFHREREGDWDNILEQYPDEKIVDTAYFSEITGIKLEQGSVHPCIKIQINNNDWKYLFFQVNDEVKKCWTRIRYMWQTYLQNHSSDFTRNNV